jgi:hypothetical protein
MRDAYTPDDQRFLDWQAGKLLPEHANPEWSAIVRFHTARGVRFRRVRVVSEPLAPFIRFEYEVTAAVSIAAREQVRPTVLVGNGSSSGAGDDDLAGRIERLEQAVFHKSVCLAERTC